MEAKLIKEKVLDYNSGYLTKSPCRSCSLKNRLPDCSDNCKKLIQLQRILAGTISSANTKDISEFEKCSISIAQFEIN